MRGGCCVSGSDRRKSGQFVRILQRILNRRLKPWSVKADRREAGLERDVSWDWAAASPISPFTR